MPKFFVPEAPPVGGRLLIDGGVFAHMKVLRLRPGDSLTLCDGCGTDYLCTVQAVGPSGVSVTVDSRQPADAEPAVFCSIYMAFAKLDKVEHVIQKATELGAFEIVVYPSARCVSRPDRDTLQKKLPRWQKIAVSAAEQSGRGRVPQVLAMTSLKEAFQRASGAELAVLLYENEDRFSLRQAVSAGHFQTASLISGPEGGFEPQEVQLARSCGLQVCSLGKRILRCETAPLCALSALLYAAGELE